MHGACMATTTISISAEAHELLKAVRRPGESFSDVIVQHLRPPPETCGRLLAELEAEFDGVPLLTPESRAALRRGRGRRSPRRD